MNQWLQDPSTNSNSHAGFGSPLDSMSFLQPPQTVNPAHFQNPPFLNGDGRTASPAFHNPIFQTNQVIPSKRSREDSIGASPRQAPGGLPGSRSQTPGQVPYPGFGQPNGAGHMSNAPTPFQHLQASNNASPSPTVQHMNFNQSSGPQRVSTTSPSPFSPQQPGHHASPGPPDHASRVGTPHDGVQGFLGNMSNPSFGPGFNQPHFNPNMANGMGPVGMNPQMNMGQQQMGISAAQRTYQMQLQAQARQLAQAQAMNASRAGVPNQGMPNVMNQMQPGAFGPPKPKNPEEFIKGLQAFMAGRGRSVELNPVICGRPLALLQLYAAVVKSGGSQKISKMQQWGMLAQQFGLPQQQQGQAAQELQTFWMNNLAPYEAAWQMSQQKQRLAAQAAMQNQMQNQMSPTRSVQHNQDPSQPGLRLDPSDLKMAPQLQNGFVPTGPQNQAMQPQHRSSLSKQVDSSQIPGMSPQKSAQVQDSKPVESEPEPTTPIKKPIEGPFRAAVLPHSRFHGPVNVEEMYTLGQQITDFRPTVPQTIRELGLIDIHALTMAIKSGMHGETRVALDTLVTLSTESQLQLNLMECDDLIETLVDCAQDQVDFLSEHAAEVSEEMSLTAYEDLVRSCKTEAEGLQDLPEYGTVEYDLDRAADRLICITTLIRNFSFYEANFAVLGQPEILKLLSLVIRNIATKELVLRSNRNTLDFMKDVIIYLSNLSTSLNLPGKEEALCFVHFLLAFAPTPPPTAAGGDKVSFTMYSPSVHKYMPSAVDSLAKLLARDEPNRTYYKAIFSADANSTPPYELLTRTFGLAISPIPASTSHIRAVIETRKPFLLQGMLAAEILSSLVPGSDHPLARSWLESDDGFALSLLRLVTMLSADKSTQIANPNAQRPPQLQHGHPHQPQRNAPEQDANAYGAITTRAVAVLRTLVQKSRVVDEEGKVVLPHGIMPRKEKLLGAMIEKDIDPGILRMLCIYAGLED